MGKKTSLGVSSNKSDFSIKGLLRALIVDCVAWILRPFVQLSAAAQGPRGLLGALWVALVGVARRMAEICSVDKRSLALFRILLAVTTIWDLGNRMRDMKAHYGDDGIMTRAQVMEWGLHNWFWTSVYFVAGHQPFVFCIFLANFAVLFCFLVGWHTRFFNALSWWFLVGIQGRMILVGHAGDCLHRILLLLGCLAPLGENFSIDAVRESKRRARDEGADEESLNRRGQILSYGFPALALLFEFIMMYYTAYYHKSAPEWRENYRAAWLALQLEFFARPVAYWMASYPWMCKQLTWAVKHWQWWGNWGLISPILFEPLRLFCAIGWQCMHFGFAIAMRLGVFAWITASGPVVMYPPFFWDKIVFNVIGTAERRGLRVYYRRGCDSCASVAHALRVFALPPQAAIVPADCCGCSACRSSHGRKGDRAEQLLSSSTGWLVAENTTTGRLTSNYEAVLDVVELSPVLWPLFPVFLRARQPVALLFSTLHFHSWGDADTGNGACGQAATLERRRRAQNPPLWREFLSLFKKVAKVCAFNGAAAFFLYVIVTYNLSNIGTTQYGPSPSIRPVIWATYTDQFWGVFAPRPPDSWWWYNFEGELHNGTKVSLFEGGGLWSKEYRLHSWEKPNHEDFYLGFKNHRWFKFFENGYNMHGRNQDIRLHFGRWVCREFLAKYGGDDRLYSYRVWMVGDRLNPTDDMGPRVSTGRRVLWEHRCYDKPKI